MTNGVLCFANNNGKIDYIKQAVHLAIRVKKYLNLPTSVVTTSPDDAKKYEDVFDKIIYVPDNVENYKRYNDGELHHQKLYFKNSARHKSYNLTPYENTIVMDTDYIICNDVLKHAFKSKHNFLIYKDGVDLSLWRDEPEFKYINDKGIEFYWATVFFFRKNAETKIFFDLLTHLVTNWKHYSEVYDLGSRNFRNDHAFSMAIHVMNGFTSGDWAKELPGKMYYTLDRDKLNSIDNEKLTFLLSKKDYRGEYTLSSISNCNVHVMNKFSLEKFL